jgi:hypothetical protein
MLKTLLFSAFVLSTAQKSDESGPALETAGACEADQPLIKSPIWRIYPDDWTGSAPDKDCAFVIHVTMRTAHESAEFGSFLKI